MTKPPIPRKTIPNFRIVYHTADGQPVLFTPLVAGSPTVIAKRVVPEGLPHKVADPANLPDRLFLSAWEVDYTPNHPAPFSINMDKAKAKVHGWRRAARDREMKPHDETVAKAIPGKTADAEAERVKLRKKYDDIQVAVDATTTPAELRAAFITHIQNVGVPPKRKP